MRLGDKKKAHSALMSIPSCLSQRLVWLLLATGFFLAAGEDSNQEAKLTRIFEKYDNAREWFQNSSDFITEEEWNDWLSYEEYDIDFQGLKDMHQKVVVEAEVKARRDSVVNIDSFRSQEDKVKDFCQDFPRAAILHIHPSGTRNRTTVEHLLEHFNPIINGASIVQVGNNPDALTKLYDDEIEFLENLDEAIHYLDQSEEEKSKIMDLFFLPSGRQHDFERFQAVFAVSATILKGDPDTYDKGYDERRTVEDFLIRAKELGLSYAEFTKGVGDPGPANSRTTSANYAIYAEETGVDVTFNVAFARTSNKAKNGEKAQALISTLESNGNPYPNLVGIDLLGSENLFPALATGQLIYPPIHQAWDDGTIPLGGLTMHAGEHGSGGPGVRNMRDGIIMGVTRIGHGVLLQDDPVILEYARRKNIGLVMSLVSNYKLKAVAEHYEHPFLRYLRLGLPISLSTDDEGMFETDIANECVVAISHSDIQYSELKALSYNAVTTSFADEETKKKLRQELDEKFAAFEKEYEDGLAAWAITLISITIMLAIAFVVYAVIQSKAKDPRNGQEGDAKAASNADDTRQPPADVRPSSAPKSGNFETKMVHVLGSRLFEDVKRDGDACETMKLPLLPSGVALQVKTAEGIIGGSIWPSAGVLCRHLVKEYHPKIQSNGKPSPRHSREKVQVLELGSGTGAVGLFAAGLGCFHKVYLTEHRPPLAAAIPSVPYNVDGSLDWALLEGENLDLPGMDRGPAKSDRLLNLLQANVDLNSTPEMVAGSPSWPPSVFELDWSIPEHVDNILEETDSPAGMDLLLASDVTYFSQLHSSLASTTARLLSTQNPNAKCLVAHQQRVLNLKGVDHQLESFERALDDAGLKITSVQEIPSSEVVGAQMQVSIFEIQHHTAQLSNDNDKNGLWLP